MKYIKLFELKLSTWKSAVDGEKERVEKLKKN